MFALEIINALNREGSAIHGLNARLENSHSSKLCVHCKANVPVARVTSICDACLAKWNRLSRW